MKKHFFMILFVLCVGALICIAHFSFFSNSHFLNATFIGFLPKNDLVQPEQLRTSLNSWHIRQTLPPLLKWEKRRPEDSFFRQLSPKDSDLTKIIPKSNTEEVNETFLKGWAFLTPNRKIVDAILLLERQDGGRWRVIGVSEKKRFIRADVAKYFHDKSANEAGWAVKMPLKKITNDRIYRLAAYCCMDAEYYLLNISNTDSLAFLKRNYTPDISSSIITSKINIETITNLPRKSTEGIPSGRYSIVLTLQLTESENNESVQFPELILSSKNMKQKAFAKPHKIEQVGSFSFYSFSFQNFYLESTNELLTVEILGEANSSLSPVTLTDDVSNGEASLNGKKTGKGLCLSIEIYKNPINTSGYLAFMYFILTCSIFTLLLSSIYSEFSHFSLVKKFF